MKKLLKTIPFVMLSLLLFCGSAFAWSIDITPVYGDQDSTDIFADVGYTVNYQLWFNPDATGTTLTSAYTWRLDFDTDELEFDLSNSTQYDMGQPGQWFMSALKEDPVGYATAGALTFSPGTTLYEPFLMADLAFLVINPVDDDFSDLEFEGVLQATNDGFGINGVFTNAGTILAEHHLTDGADVAPVPIPGALWLMISGLPFIVRIRRKNA